MNRVFSISYITPGVTGLRHTDVMSTDLTTALSAFIKALRGKKVVQLSITEKFNHEDK